MCLLWMLPLAFAAIAHALTEGERSSAFIGYTENAHCADRYTDCVTKALNNGCIYDPYTMRRFCPKSCNVDRCTTPGTIKMKHKGQATELGTAAYADWMQKAHGVPEEHYKKTSLVAADPTLTLASLGIGTYLGALDRKTDEAVTTAVVYSVTHGWNVIDTASTYRGGRAELSIGHALDQLLSGNFENDFYQGEGADTSAANVARATNTTAPKQPDITRDMLFISTKAGFVSPKRVQSLIKAGKLLTGDVAGGQHCIHPSCLEVSLKQSLESMNLEKVDLLYLHNAAEVQLRDLGKVHFLERIKAAFTYLESARIDGLLDTYGIATWDCFRVPPSDPGYLSLEEVVAVAKEVGGPTHGLRYVQLPINVEMNEALTQAWQSVAGSNMTLLDAAKGLNIGVFASGPLGEGGLLKQYTGRLDGVKELVDIRSTAGKMLQYVRSTPGLLTALVGQKTREFVESNVAVALLPMLTREEFDSAFKDVQAALER